MRHTGKLCTLVLGAALISGCAEQSGEDTVERAFQDVNVVDESNLNDVMMTVADPNEAVAHFSRSVQQSPDRIDLHRGLARSLVRARRYSEATAAWARVIDLKEATDTDRVDYADALLRAGDWATAEQVLDAIPPTHETYARYRLEAMVADSNQEWSRADSFYETAAGLTTEPARVLNNWGYSKLTRGDHAGAEQLFLEAVALDEDMFTAKNNLVLARAARRDYTLPVVPMDQQERAQLLHTMALAAIKSGDVETGKGLLRDAIDTHPQYFEPAHRALEALEGTVSNG